MQLVIQIIALHLVFIQVAKGNNVDRPLVVTNFGTVRGLRAEDGDYDMFMGVPYATVDESNPFGMATAYPDFIEVFDADDDTKACPQIEEFNNTIIGSPDCLNLNIYVPDSASTQNPAAVLVWIHGGGFAYGSTFKYIHGPKYFMKQDVILVAIHYRLGPYGFMCLHTPEVPGNQGLRDQFLAMKWIKENIAEFGGDPNRVTIFGNSAGAMSIDYHVWSEQEKLYNGIILQSGTAFTVQASSEPNTNGLLLLAEALGLTTSDVNEAINFVSTRSSNDVIQAESTIPAWFGPCIEKEIPGIERIITQNVVNLELPKAEGLKVMLGYNDDEMMIRFALSPPELFTLYQNDFTNHLVSRFDFDTGTLTVLERLIRNFYVGDDDFNQEMMFDLANFHSDVDYVFATERSLQRYADNGADVYYYVFSYNGGRNFLKRRLNLEVGGAYHADEVSYLFEMQLFPEEPLPEDQLIIDRMTAMWANFAKYGDPTPETTQQLPVKWEPIKKGSVYHYLNITGDITTGRRPFQQRMTFWDLFYQAYGQYERTFKSRSSAVTNTVGSLTFVVSVVAFNMFN